MVLNMFFKPLSISYDAWMMSHIKLENFFLRLKIGPKVTFSPKCLLTVYCPKVKALKESPQKNHILVPYFEKA